MEREEKEILSESATSTLHASYMLLLLALGLEEAGRVVAGKVYPALLELGWMPPVGLHIESENLGPRGRRLYETFRGEADEDVIT